MSSGPARSAPAVVALADGLVQLSFVLQGVLTRLAEQHDLSVTQLRLLAVLEDREVGMQQLAGILEIGKSSLTGLVDRAERRGLVERVPVPGNRRATHVVLTPEARSLVALVRGRVQTELARLSSGLTDEQRDALVASVDSLLDSYAREHAVPW